MVSQCTKFEVSRFTRYEAVNSGAKCRKWGWFEVVRGHSRSWAMPPFDRAHTTFYSTLIETMCLSFTVFEIQPVICRKSPILMHPTCIWRPPQGGNPRRISRRSLASQNQAIVWCCLCDPTFSRFSRTPTCDRQTDTDGHRAMASTADAQHRAVKTDRYSQLDLAHRIKDPETIKTKTDVYSEDCQVFTESILREFVRTLI